MILDDKSDKTHWHGKKNKAIRYFFYIQRGLALFNEFRYIMIAIFGIYISLKLDNPIWLVGMFATACPLLIAAGWASTHHIGKVVDWLNIRFATHYSLYQFTLLEGILEELKTLNAKDK